MVIAGEITPDFDERTFDFDKKTPIPHTSFAGFYGKMIKTPFFGDKYNVIAPLFILVCSIAFTFMGVFNYRSKRVDSLILFN